MKHTELVKFVRLTLLTTLMFVLSFTPIGYLNIGPLAITFLTIPVIVGAINDGPYIGAFLGGVFGLTSFLQAMMGLSKLGAILFAINPGYSLLLCFAPRILTGFLCGLFFRLLKKTKLNQTVSVYLSALTCPLMNTIFYLGTMILLFGRSDYILTLQNGRNVFVFLASFVGINGISEAVVCPIVGTAISLPLLKMFSPKGANYR